MSGRRLLAVLIGVAGIAILAIVVILLVSQSGEPEATPPPVADTAGVAGTLVAPTATPLPTIAPEEAMVEVVVSLQTVPRGWQMTEAELTTDMRLASEVGSGMIVRVEDAVGLYARQDIYQGETLTTDTLVRDPTLIGIENFGPSSLVPQGWVALAVPMDRLSSVAYGLAPGDTIDIMLTFTLSAIDEQFQTLLSNSATFYLEETVGEGEGEEARPTIFIVDPYGRFETLPTNDVAHVGPSENTERPTAVSVILQNARVVNVGAYQPRPPAVPPTPTPLPDAPTPTPDPNAVPTPTPAPPDVLLIALPPQQQLFMDYALEVNGDIDFALRGVNDGQLYSVQNVDFNYLLQQFNIAVPPNTTYTIGGLSTTSLEAGEVEVQSQGAAQEGQAP